MNAYCLDLLAGLLRTTLFLTAAVAIVQLLLTISRCQSPRVHRIAWCAALVQGLLFAQVSFPVAWTPRFMAAEPVENETLLPPIFEGGGLPPVALPSNPVPEAPPSPVSAKPVAVEPPGRNLIELVHSWWAVALVGAWLAGMLLIAARARRQYARFARHLSTVRPCPDAWREEFEDVLTSFEPRGKRRLAVALHVSEKVGPLLCRRWSGYALIVPEALWATLAPRERIAILRHELAHLRRGDLWKSLAVRAMALPHWFNPCAWYAVRRFDEAGEWTCDQLATKDAAAAADYARVLVRICEGCRPASILASPACGSSVSRRVRRLVSQVKEDSAMKQFLLCGIACLLVVAGVMRVQFVGAADEGSGKPSKQALALVEAAKNAYMAVAAAYEAQTVTFESMSAWSRTWLRAELDAAVNKEQRIAAYRSYINRTDAAFRKIEALYRVSTTGGEAEKYGPALFYLAEAKAMLRKEDKDATENFELVINKGGAVSYKGNPGRFFDDNELLAHLKSEADLERKLGYDPAEIEVMIYADREAHAENVQRIIEICKEAGFDKIALRAVDSPNSR